MSFNANVTQLNSFVQFAETHAKDAIATIQTDGKNFGTHAIGLSTTKDSIGSIGKMFRSQDSKLLNDATRSLFKDTVANLFGGEKNIPSNVLKAMNLEDFGKGKPLSARRIMAVKGEIDKSFGLIKNNVESKINTELNQKFSKYKLDEHLQTAISDAATKNYLTGDKLDKLFYHALNDPICRMNADNPQDRQKFNTELTRFEHGLNVVAKMISDGSKIDKSFNVDKMDAEKFKIAQKLDREIDKKLQIAMLHVKEESRYNFETGIRTAARKYNLTGKKLDKLVSHALNDPKLQSDPSAWWYKNDLMDVAKKLAENK